LKYVIKYSMVCAMPIAFLDMRCSRTIDNHIGYWYASCGGEESLMYVME